MHSSRPTTPSFSQSWAGPGGPGGASDPGGPGGHRGLPRRPPISAPGTPRAGAISPTSSVASYSGAVQRSRRAHDAETRLWQAEHKLVDAQSKLTGANLEIRRLRSAAEQHDHDMLYVRRLLEREQREKNALEAEVLSLRQQLKRASPRKVGFGDGADGAVEGERIMLLKAQLEDATERSKAHIAEVDRLRDEVERLRGCLNDHREPGQLRSELAHVRDERVRLALELYEAKQAAVSAHAQAQHATQQVAAVDALRASTSEAQAQLAESRAHVSGLHEEHTSLQHEYNHVLGMAQQLADELQRVRHEHGQVAEQKLALIERLNATEHTLSALRHELKQREDDFQVDLSLFAARDAETRASIDRLTAEGRTARARAEELETLPPRYEQRIAQLEAEIRQLRKVGEAHAARAQHFEEERGQLAGLVEVSEIELRRNHASNADRIERQDAKNLMLSHRLEATLKELQATIHERDRLSATLEEALMRCTSSLVARQLAEDDCKAALRQLDAMRTLQAVYPPGR